MVEIKPDPTLEDIENAPGESDAEKWMNAWVLPRNGSSSSNAVSLLSTLFFPPLFC